MQPECRDQDSHSRPKSTAQAPTRTHQGCTALPAALSTQKLKLSHKEMSQVSPTFLKTRSKRETEACPNWEEPTTMWVSDTRGGPEESTDDIRLILLTMWSPCSHGGIREAGKGNVNIPGFLPIVSNSGNHFKI